MARKGRTTELIVKELENLCFDKDICEIHSPDSIEDVITKRKREIDVSIRCKIGNLEFLTMIECRNRQKVDDVTWVEQVKTKKDDIKADKAIMVSTSGFSGPAELKAEHNGIILRTLTNFKAEETIEWLEGCVVREPKFIIINAAMKLLDAVTLTETGKDNKFSKKITADERNILVESAGEYINLPDIVISANVLNDNYLFNGLEDNASPVKKEMKLPLYPDTKLLIEFDDKKFYIKTLEFELKTWIEASDVSYTDAFRYKQGDDLLSDKVDFEIEVSNNKFVFTVIKDHQTGLIKLPGSVLKK